MMNRSFPPQFAGVVAGATNIASKRGEYTLELFRRDRPQFFDAEGNPLAPESIMYLFIGMANDTISTDKWGSQAEYCAGLFVAHRLSMYLKTYAPSSATPRQAAASGALTGVVRSATLGDISVSYDTSALTSATSEWGDLNATQYGQELASIARMIGMAGSYAI